MIIKNLLLSGLLFVAGCSFFEGVTPLMKASKHGNIEEVKKYISKESINKKSIFGWTALMFASQEGHKDIVTLLLANGADPNILSKSIPARFETTGDTPPTTALDQAIQNNHLSVARLIIEYGANIDVDAFANAGASRDIDLVRLMIKKGAKINASSNSAFYPSALCVASKEGDLDMVKFLLKLGANINKVYFNHINALREAVSGNQVEVVKYLLKEGADPSIELDNRTVLYEAITLYTEADGYSKNEEIVRLLIKYGADIYHKPFGFKETILEEAKNIYYNILKDYETMNIPKKEKDEMLKHELNIIKILESQVVKEKGKKESGE